MSTDLIVLTDAELASPAHNHTRIRPLVDERNTHNYCLTCRDWFYPNTRIQTLECCCCGNRARGRQWWNRDTGYGFCPRCSRLFAGETQVGQENRSYGVRGYHYDVIEPHANDFDCCVDPDTNLCLICGVLHAEPCPDCNGRGYHFDKCATQEA